MSKKKGKIEKNKEMKKFLMSVTRAWSSIDSFTQSQECIGVDNRDLMIRFKYL